MLLASACFQLLMVMYIVFVLFAAQPTLGSRLMTGLFDDTFAGIYRLSPFDWALLIPYFSILGVLSIYGIHRYETIRRYKKYKANLPTEAPQRFEKLPPVTI